MNLEEFKKAAPHALLRKAKACKVLQVTGKSASEIPLHKLEDGGPGITTVEDLATEYFYKVGPNVRRLGPASTARTHTHTHTHPSLLPQEPGHLLGSFPKPAVSCKLALFLL